VPICFFCRSVYSTAVRGGEKLEEVWEANRTIISHNTLLQQRVKELEEENERLSYEKESTIEHFEFQTKDLRDKLTTTQKGIKETVKIINDTIYYMVPGHQSKMSKALTILNNLLEGE